MVDLTEEERAAITATMKRVALLMDEIGWATPLADLTEAQVHALIDDSPRHVLSEMADAVASLGRELGRPLTLIAESDLNDVTMVTPTAEGGLGMDGQWADDVHHALHS